MGPGQIRRIAHFMDVTLNDALLAVVLENSSFAYMQAHSTKFDEHIVFGKVREQMGIPKDYVFGDVEVSKVRVGGGKIGEGKTGLPDEVVKMLRNRWELTVKSKTGFDSYAAMREAISKLP